MLCFLVKAHHHWKLSFMFISYVLSPSSCFSFTTKSRIDSSEWDVLLLNGIRETSQQYSRTWSSWSSVSPTKSSTFIRLDLPRILSYRVPLGIPNLTLACVNLSCCLITQSIAWYIWLCVHVGLLVLNPSGFSLFLFLSLMFLTFKHLLLFFVDSVVFICKGKLIVILEWVFGFLLRLRSCGWSWEKFCKILTFSLLCLLY